jgi:hypothetical protein
MANVFNNDFNSSALTGFTSYDSVGGSFSFISNYQPSLGDPNPTVCLKISGGQTNFGQTGICMTNPLPANPANHMIFWQFSLDGGQAIISLENSNKLWTTNVGVVSIHYNSVGPVCDLYSGTVNTFPDALPQNEWIDHFFEITPTGAILARHRHYTVPGTIYPYSSFRNWSDGSWGLTDSAQYVNYATSSTVRWSLTYFGAVGQACYLDEFWVSNNGLIQRKPLSLVVTPGITSVAPTATWNDNAST